MIPNEPVVYKNVITEDERVLLKEHAFDLLNSGQMIVNTSTPGNYRNMKAYFSLDKMPDLHVNLYDKVVYLLNLKNPVIDPALGIIVSVIKPGGHIHSHRDLYSSFPNTKHLTNKRNVRFNVMVDRGEDNCYNPTIEGKFYEVNRCDGWCFAASVYRHRTELVSGPECRVVYQFGFCMDAI